MLESHAIQLEAEPLNEYDSNAIAVNAKNESGEIQQIGYVAQDHTKFVKQFVGQSLNVTVNSIYKQSISLNIKPIEIQ